MTMRLACVVAISGYSPTDLASKRESLKAILRPDTQLDMFAALSGVLGRLRANVTAPKPAEVKP